MDENLRIYYPKENILNSEWMKREPVPYQKKIKSAFDIPPKNEKWYITFRNIFKEKNNQEKELREKYPLFNLGYNWLIILILSALLVSSIVFGIRSNTEKVAVAYAETAVANFKAEEQMKTDQQELLRKQEEQNEAIIEHNIVTKLARMYQCADKFVDKYGYSERDFKSLGRCVFNRVENPSYSDDIIDVIDQPNQWVGYDSSMNFTPMTKYYDMAQKHYREWKKESTKPISNDYLWAEYTSKGIFLKYQYDAGPYDPRWRAST